MRIVLFLIIFLQILSAYITATNGGLKSNNRLEYSGGKFIDTTKGFNTNFDFIINPYYREKISKKIIPIKCPQDSFDNVKRCKKEVSVIVVDRKNLFNFITFRDFNNGMEVLLNGTTPILISKKITSLNSKIFGDLENVVKYSVKNKKSGTTIFEIYFKNDLPLKIVTNNKTFLLEKIVNRDVVNYQRLKKELKTELDNFDYTKEPIWAKYIVKTSNGVRYLDVKFKLENRETGIFSVELKGSGLILEPFKQQDIPYQIVSYLIDLNKLLFQYQKILKVNFQNVLLWRQLPKAVEVPLVYIDENGKQRKKLIFRDSAKPMYDFGGLWYLISWCNKHNKDRFPFSYITDGRVEGQIKKIAKNHYNVKTLIGDRILNNWDFILDNYNRVIEVKNLKYGMVIKLKDKFMTETIEKNIRRLNNYKLQHNLRDIK